MKEEKEKKRKKKTMAEYIKYRRRAITEGREFVSYQEWRET